MKTMSEEDRCLKRLLKYPSGLRAGGGGNDPKVVASYWTTGGLRSFAFCLEGILVDPDGEKRLIPFKCIADTGLYDMEALATSKSLLKAGLTERETLSLRLHSGELIEMPLNERRDGISERLTIAGLIERDVRIAGGSSLKHDPTSD